MYKNIFALTLLLIISSLLEAVKIKNRTGENIVLEFAGDVRVSLLSKKMYEASGVDAFRAIFRNCITIPIVLNRVDKVIFYLEGNTIIIAKFKGDRYLETSAYTF